MTAFEKAVLALLEPLAAGMLRKGLGARALVKLAKTAFVNACARNHRGKGLPLNVSAIARETGLTRRDVSNLLTDEEYAPLKAGNGPIPPYVVDSLILSRWATNNDYLDGIGEPKEIPLGGDAPSFAALVEHANSAESVDSVLRRMARRGEIEIQGNASCRMISRNSLISESLAELLLDTAVPAVSTSVHNWLDAGRNRLCQRTSSIPRPTVKSITLCRKYAHAKIGRFIEDIDAQLESIKSNDVDSSANADGTSYNGRIGVCAFYFEVDT